MLLKCQKDKKRSFRKKSKKKRNSLAQLLSYIKMWKKRFPYRHQSTSTTWLFSKKTLTVNLNPIDFVQKNSQNFNHLKNI